MKLKLLIALSLLICFQQLYSQENYKTVYKVDSTKIYSGGAKYTVETFTQKFK